MKLFSLVIFAILLSSMVLGASIGISPAGLVADNLNRGSVYEQKILVSRSPAEEELYVNVLVHPPFKGWITTDKGTEILFPKSVNKIPIIVKLTVPNDAANGFYKGSLGFTLSPDSTPIQSKIGSKISAGVAAVIEANVTGEQVIDYDVRGIEIPDTEVKKTINVKILLKNNGPIKIKPSRVEVTLFNNLKNAQIGAFNASGSMEIDAYSEGSAIYTVPNDFEEDSYWANVRVFEQDELKFSQDVRFAVLAVGGLKRTGEYKSLNVTSGDVKEPVTFSSVFSNTGELPLTAVLKGEVKRDKKLIEVIESDELLVQLGETVPITMYFTPEEEGIYTFSAKVYYEGRSTPSKTTGFVIGKNVKMEKYLYWGIGIIILLLIIGVVGYFIYDEYF